MGKKTLKNKNNKRIISRRKIILNVLKDDALSNFNIEDIIKAKYNNFNKKFRGTFCWDELCLPIHKNGQNVWGIIINTLNSSAKPDDCGHWVSLIVDNNKKQFLYYDSFGENPKYFEQFKNTIKKFKKYPNSEYQLKINAIQNQKSTTSNCGYFAINFLKNILRDNKTFKQSTDFNTQSGEHKIELLKKSFGVV